jgi:hypothetical protein
MLMGQTHAQDASTAAATPVAPSAQVVSAPVAPNPGVPVSGAGGPCCTVPAGTLIDLELADSLSSHTNKRGDKFALKLATPVQINGLVVLPADTQGIGEIVDAGPAGGGGAPGKLLLAGRYLTWNGTQIPLRGLKLGGAGKSEAGKALGVSLVAGPFAMFIHGGEIELPAGTHVDAKIAADTLLAPIVNPGSPGASGGPASSPPPSNPSTSNSSASNPSAASSSPHQE